MTTPVGDADQLEALAAVGVVATLDRLSDGILVLADDWTIEYINQPVGEMIGRPHEELLGRNIWGEFPEAVGGRFHLAYEEARRTGCPQRVVEIYEPLDSWFEIRVFAQGGKLIGLVRDVTDQQHVEHELRQFTRVERALGLSRRRLGAIVDNTPSMISVKDLAGRYLMSNAEFERVVGRSSAELLGRRCTDFFPPEIAERQREIDRRAAADGKPVYGEAVLPGEDGEDRSYVTVTFALPDEHGVPTEICTIATDVTERREREDQRRARLAWADRLSAAMTQGRLAIFAQPIVAASGGERVASELLVRMREQGGSVELIPPADFLLTAERYGLIQEIDTWMVRQALALPRDERYQVNLSALTMCDVVARSEILELLKAEPAAARRLTFEITETASVDQLSAARSFAAEVIAAGSRLALDDFGVGFGSFTYLRSLPFSLLKIDKGFVRRLTTSRDDRRVIRGTIGIAREFGIETIAEGVENEATMEALRELGVNYAQGFHLGAPAPLPHPAGASAGGRA